MNWYTTGLIAAVVFETGLIFILLRSLHSWQKCGKLWKKSSEQTKANLEVARSNYQEMRDVAIEINKVSQEAVARLHGLQREKHDWQELCLRQKADLDSMSRTMEQLASRGLLIKRQPSKGELN